ncbi:MAG: hypothetical protein ACOC44_18420 [Promethearchaeia archaeon]
MKKVSLKRAWKIANEYDRYKVRCGSYILTNKGLQGEMAVINKETGKEVDSLTIPYMNKSKFLRTMKQIKRKKPKDLGERLSGSDLTEPTGGLV